MKKYVFNVIETIFTPNYDGIVEQSVTEHYIEAIDKLNAKRKARMRVRSFGFINRLTGGDYHYDYQIKDLRLAAQ